MAFLKKGEAAEPAPKGKKGVAEVKSWYQDKAFILKVQRNILLIICLLMFASIVASLVVIKTIVESKSIEPYVIRVSKSEQIPISVNIDSIRNYVHANQGVLEYFLIEYIKMREGYIPDVSSYEYNTILRRMSSAGVYRVFSETTNHPLTGVPLVLGRSGRIDVAIKQIAIEQKSNIVVARIAKRLTRMGDVRGITHFKIKMHYVFDTTNMSYRDIVLNPLGLKIDFYEVVEEKAFVNDETYDQIF